MKSKNKLLLVTGAAILIGNTAVKTATAQSSEAKCVGGNTCKGQSACQTANSSCAGQNSCKGTGWVITTKEDCKKNGGKFKEEE